MNEIDNEKVNGTITLALHDEDCVASKKLASESGTFKDVNVSVINDDSARTRDVYKFWIGKFVWVLDCKRKIAHKVEASFF